LCSRSFEASQSKSRFLKWVWNRYYAILSGKKDLPPLNSLNSKKLSLYKKGGGGGGGGGRSVNFFKLRGKKTLLPKKDGGESVPLRCQEPLRRGGLPGGPGGEVSPFSLLGHFLQTSLGDSKSSMEEKGKKKAIPEGLPRSPNGRRTSY